MKSTGLFARELHRLLHSRPAWLALLLTLLSPLAGLFLYKPATADTMLSLYLANPALAGGAAGGIFFGLLAVLELDRVNRSRMDALVDAAVPPLRMAVVRLTALLAAGLLATAVTMLAWLPVTWSLVGSVFDLTDYCLAYLIFMGLALPLAILAAAAFYQFTRRMDLSLVLFSAFCGLSLTLWADEWQLCWLNPSVWALSDDFSNFGSSAPQPTCGLPGWWLWPVSGGSPACASASMEKDLSALLFGVSAESAAPFWFWLFSPPPSRPTPSSPL